MTEKQPNGSKTNPIHVETNKHLIVHPELRMARNELKICSLLPAARLMLVVGTPLCVPCSNSPFPDKEHKTEVMGACHSQLGMAGT